MLYLKRNEWRRHFILAAIVFVFAFTWLGSALSSSSVASAGNQGRYLFPGVAAWAAMMAFGLEIYFRRFQKSLLILMGIFAAVCLISLFGYFYPAYQALPLPENIEQPLDLRYEGIAELIGMSPANPEGRAGESISIELYWRALSPASPNLQTYIHTAFAENVLWRDSIPANGHRPADDWQVGEGWTERYIFTIPADIPAGTEFLIVAGLYEPQSGESLMAYNREGQEINAVPVIATLRIIE